MLVRRQLILIALAHNLKIIPFSSALDKRMNLDLEVRTCG